MTEDQIREFVKQGIQDAGKSLSEVSTRLGRNHAYLQQFVERKVPAAIPENLRAQLAAEIGCKEIDLVPDDRRRPADDKLSAAPIGVAEDTAPFLRPNARYAGPAPDITTWPRDLPVYGTAIGGSEEHGAFEFNTGDKIDHIRRPPVLSGVAEAFAIYLVGPSMEPRFRDGAPILVHPKRPPRPGDDVLVELHPTQDGGPHPALVKRLVSRTDTRLRLQQFNPPSDNIIMPMRRVLKIHRIVPPEDYLTF